MSIKNRRVSLTGVNEFLRLVTLFRQTFLDEFTRRLHEPTTPEPVETATVRDAFASACHQCLARLQADGASGSGGSSESSVGRAA